MNRQKGFTLIELLVVITIIVILIALLTPALDKAIYQAELAVDGASLRTISNGSLLYATENKRFYFKRAVLVGGGRPNVIKYSTAGDDRKRFKSYIPLQAFNDPLAAPQIKFDEGSNGSDTVVYVPHPIWAGWSYSGHAGMNKIGDRFAYPDLDVPGKINRFNILAADQDWINGNLTAVHAAHHDDEGLLTLAAVQDENTVGEVLNEVRVLRYTLSEWNSRVSAAGRGNLDDVHYAPDDGSIFKYQKVTMTHSNATNANALGDERVKPVDIDWSGATGANYFFIPPVR